ncbi:MAG: ABC transporter substrate-binding protein [Eubacteriales bacterium]|nr:ABC transporter substrate-binding protein [Eubacteriales bacterium]
MTDQELVYEAINELTMKELNMKVNLIPMTFGARQEQLQLMLVGGEALDIYPQNAQYMDAYVEAGFATDLTDYLSQMPNVQKWVGEEYVRCSNVGGFIWGVPSMKERAIPIGLVFRKDIMDELGVSIDDLHSLNDVTALFAKVHEAYPDMTVFGGTSGEGLGFQGDQAGVMDPLNNEWGVLANYGEDLTVVNEFEQQDWIDLVTTAHEWWESGYTSKNMPTSTDSGVTLMANGNLFCFYSNSRPNTAAEKEAQCGYPVEVYYVTEPLMTTTAVGSYAFAISGTSQQPEAAVKFLDWAFGSGEFNDLLNFGIEGKHWVEAEDGTATFPAGVDASTTGYYLNWGWALPNQFAGHLWTGNDLDLYEQYVAFQGNGHVSKALGFAFDSSNVTDEIIACSAVRDEYIVAITTGSVDPTTAVAEFNNALYAAGLQTIMDEKQAQLDAWAAANNVQ